MEKVHERQTTNQKDLRDHKGSWFHGKEDFPADIFGSIVILGEFRVAIIMACVCKSFSRIIRSLRNNKIIVENILSVSAGFDYTMVCSSRRVQAFGAMLRRRDHHPIFLGAKGVNTPTEVNVMPYPVHRILEIRGVSAGSEHSLLWSSDGDLLSIGTNSRGQLGNGSCRPFKVPMVVRGPWENRELGIKIKILGAVAGCRHSIMWSEDGAVYSCGEGAHGRLGHGDDRNRETPERIQSMIGKRVVGATASQHSLLWDENGCLYAFGVTEQGRLGIGAPPASFVVTPTMIQSFTEEDREGGQEGGQEGGVVKDLKKVGFIALPLHPFDLTNQPPPLPER